MPTVAYTLGTVAYKGIINEDVMQQIWNIDPVDLPYMDMAGTGDAATNPYHEWVKESLAAPSVPTPVLDGADAPAVGTFTESRIGNHCEINTKKVEVSDRAREVDTIGYSDRLIHEVMIRQKEMKRQMETGMLTNKASVAMTDSVPGQYAGAGAMFTTAANIINGTTGGFSSGIFAAATPGAARAMTETDVRTGMAAAYKAGGNPTLMMSVPEMIQKFSEYLFTASARIATVMSEATVKNGKYDKQGINAIGAVNTFVTDFGTLELVPNRTQLNYTVSATTTCCNVYLFDPRYWEVSYLQGIRTVEVARTGLSAKRMLSVDYTHCALQEKSSAVMMGMNYALAVTAS
jgi:hypothetical protein